MSPLLLPVYSDAMGNPIGTSAQRHTHTGGGIGFGANVSSGFSTRRKLRFDRKRSPCPATITGARASCQSIHYDTLDRIHVDQVWIPLSIQRSVCHSIPTSSGISFFAVDNLGHAKEVQFRKLTIWIFRRRPCPSVEPSPNRFRGQTGVNCYPGHVRGRHVCAKRHPQRGGAGGTAGDGWDEFPDQHGGDWTDTETWIAASGTTAWSLDTASVVWTLYETYTVTARAFDQLNNMGQASVQFTYEGDTPDTVAPTSTAFPPSGSYASAQTVNIVCNDSGGSGCADTYYTLDGTAPTTGSTPYTDPIAVTVSTTLRYFSRDRAGNSETPKTETYTIEDPGAPEANTPSFSPDPGGYRSALNVTLSCATPNSTIRYTTDDSAPHEGSAVYDGTPIEVTETTVIQARAFASGLAPSGIARGVYRMVTEPDLTPSLKLLLLD